MCQAIYLLTNEPLTFQVFSVSVCHTAPRPAPRRRFNMIYNKSSIHPNLNLRAYIQLYFH